ncbi:MAG: hypothetical protein JXB06_00830 [Spirochaetales bacterium]|nr:hypothetical protein [Spirochaetales bacterium]
MDETELWQFVRIDEYKVPETGVERVRKGLAGLLSGFPKGRKKSTSDSPLDPKQDLLCLSEKRLERAVPSPDWKDAAERLQEWLRSWLETAKPDIPALFFIAPPHSGREELLLRWASEHDVALAEQPTAERILGGDISWLDSWPKAEPWLLPRLERCFLRSTEGLDLVRSFLARVLSGRMGRGIVGCDSWAWSFLAHAGPARTCSTITTQAFDAQRLKLLFARCIDADGGSASAFRQADNGAHLLRTDQDQDETDPGGAETFWRRLAAHARGNIGIAAAWWRRALRTLPEGDLKEDRSDAQGPRQETVWVTPWEDLQRPVLPEEAGETERFVLHALLLHGGLEAQRLTAILPAERAAVIQALAGLAEAQLVEQRAEQWRVTAWGYPAVRGALTSDDYLCDSF